MRWSVYSLRVRKGNKNVRLVGNCCSKEHQNKYKCAWLTVLRRANNTSLHFIWKIVTIYFRRIPLNAQQNGLKLFIISLLDAVHDSKLNKFNGVLKNRNLHTAESPEGLNVKGKGATPVSSNGCQTSEERIEKHRLLLLRSGN